MADVDEALATIIEPQVQQHFCDIQRSTVVQDKPKLPEETDVFPKARDLLSLRCVRNGKRVSQFRYS